MPIFEGWNPEGWIFCVERFFSAHHMSDQEKVTIATISLDRETLAWFQWEDGWRPIRNWGELKTRLLNRFSHAQEGTLCEQFLFLKQKGTVREYLHAFELLAATLEDVPEHV